MVPGIHLWKRSDGSTVEQLDPSQLSAPVRYNPKPDLGTDPFWIVFVSSTKSSHVRGCFEWAGDVLYAPFEVSAPPDKLEQFIRYAVRVRRLRLESNNFARSN